MLTVNPINVNFHIRQIHSYAHTHTMYSCDKNWTIPFRFFFVWFLLLSCLNGFRVVACYDFFFKFQFGCIRWDCAFNWMRLKCKGLKESILSKFNFCNSIILFHFINVVVFRKNGPVKRHERFIIRPLQCWCGQYILAI